MALQCCTVAINGTLSGGGDGGLKPHVRGLCLFRVSYHCAVNYGETKAHQFGIPIHHHGTVARTKEA